MVSTEVQIDEDLFDVGNRIYGHPLGVHWLIDDNDLSGLNFQVIPGQKLLIRDAQIELVPIKSVTFLEQSASDYLIDEYQSLFDLAIEKHGDIEGVFVLVEQNGYDGITEYLWHRRPVKVEVNSKALNTRIQRLLADYMPIATIEETDKSDGIGFMYIERNFIVR